MGTHKNKHVRGSLTSAQKGLFVAGTKFSDVSGRIASPFREMSIGQELRSGRHARSNNGGRGLKTKWFTDPRKMELPSNYQGSGASKVGNKMTTRYKWQATADGGIIVLKDHAQLYRHLISVAHQIPIATEHWRMVLARRALAVFQESFTLKRFNSDGERNWKNITPWTRRKRKWKGTWPGAGKLMQETNALFKSLHVEDGAFTSSVVASAHYAGIHNCPESGMTYGNGFGGKYAPPKPVTQRQFMGHSTKIDEFIVAYEKNYLFDTIFRRPVLTK